MIYMPVIDADYIRYAAGFASEKRSIKVVHTKTGDELLFKNRTEFYGRGKAKDKGWIGEQNAILDVPLSAMDYDIFDIQTPEPIDHVLFTVKRMFDGILHHHGTQKYLAYYGVGESFRVDRSTILKYKGNREGTLKPMQIEEITEYMVKKYGMIPCLDLEADDWCIIEGQAKDRVVVTHDKDANGCAVNVWNPTKPDTPIIDCRGFGEIFINDSGKTKKIDGYGRKFFYYQIAYGDDVDNYRANSASELEWGEMSAFNAMTDTANDKEAIQALVKIFQHLYPVPRKVYGWRGDVITVDWLYMLQEQWTMAHMWRNPTDDNIDVREVLDKVGIKYD